MDSPKHSLQDPPGEMKDLGHSMDEIHDSEESMTSELRSAGSENLHRTLGGKEIQMLAVGGAIGTCKLYQIMRGLHS
jgi:yeast amino acid transporter